MNKTDTESLCSNMSDMSISYGGEEMDLDDAIDHIFKELQNHINETHVQIREMCQWDLRGEDYDDVMVYFKEMELHIREGCSLFKDLISVMRQVIKPLKPKAPRVTKIKE